MFDDTEASYLSVEIGIFRQLLEQVDHSAQVELEASRDSFKIRSFYQTLAGGPAAQRHMSSEMVMHTREFLQYNFRSRERTEELVIATKELKSIIAFCEAIEIPIFSIYFYGGGRPCKLCCEHASFVVSLVVATLEPPNRNSANRGNNGELGSDMQAEEQAVFHKNSKRNDANIDSTIRRLAPISAEEHVNSSQLENGLQESPSERSSNMAYHAGFNIGVLADKNDETLNRKKKARLESSDTDESDKKYNDIMYAEDLAKFPRQEQQQNICDVHEKSKNICFTGDSDEVLGPSKVAFSRSSLKRLIDSDSDDDGFDELRKL